MKTVHSFYLLGPTKQLEFQNWFFWMRWQLCRSDLVQILDQKTFYIPNFHLFVGGERGFRFQVHIYAIYFFYIYAIYECIVYWHISQQLKCKGENQKQKFKSMIAGIKILQSFFFTNNFMLWEIFRYFEPLQRVHTAKSVWQCSGSGLSILLLFPVKTKSCFQVMFTQVSQVFFI